MVDGKKLFVGVTVGNENENANEIVDGRKGKKGDGAIEKASTRGRSASERQCRSHSRLGLEGGEREW